MVVSSSFKARVKGGVSESFMFQLQHCCDCFGGVVVGLLCVTFCIEIIFQLFFSVQETVKQGFTLIFFFCVPLSQIQSNIMLLTWQILISPSDWKAGDWLATFCSGCRKRFLFEVFCTSHLPAAAGRKIVCQTRRLWQKHSFVKSFCIITHFVFID